MTQFHCTTFATKYNISVHRRIKAFLSFCFSFNWHLKRYSQWQYSTEPVKRTWNYTRNYSLNYIKFTNVTFKVYSSFACINIFVLSNENNINSAVLIFILFWLRAVEITLNFLNLILRLMTVGVGRGLLNVVNDYIFPLIMRRIWRFYVSLWLKRCSLSVLFTLDT